MLNTGQLLIRLNREINLSNGMILLSTDFSERASLTSRCDALNDVRDMIMSESFDEELV
jgi:hypothetical protein